WYVYTAGATTLAGGADVPACGAAAAGGGGAGGVFCASGWPVVTAGIPGPARSSASVMMRNMEVVLQLWVDVSLFSFFDGDAPGGSMNVHQRPSTVQAAFSQDFPRPEVP